MIPQRIQRQRTKGSRMPPNTVSVTRPGKWGNPFVCGPAFESEMVKIPEVTPADAVALYRTYLERSLADHASTRAALAELRGKNLACWCKPGAPCHADVLLELANR
ncbi:DUF4326 domain-containing protein [Bradyrhizobium sp. PUT101]|uniref:DUF4326 domain-containing protein n=1 Tax=Bradyrhizobium sp. PUT101 TaxID=3447427 RepID=UPI003F827F1A